MKSNRELLTIIFNTIDPQGYDGYNWSIWAHPTLPHAMTVTQCCGTEDAHPEQFMTAFRAVGLDCLYVPADPTEPASVPYLIVWEVLPALVPTVVVTRHPALVAYLIEQGIIAAGTPVLEHATPDDVRGKRVIGVLPHHLSSIAAEVVEVPLNIPADARGRELTLDEMRAYAGIPATYRVWQGDKVWPTRAIAASEATP